MNAALNEAPIGSSDVDPLLRAEADAALAAAPELGPLPGEPAPAPAQSEETAAMCRTLLDVTFNQLVAPRSGDHWRLNGDECKTLGDAYGALLDKYFPNLRSGPEAAAIIVTLAVFGPRVMVHASKAADAQKKPAAASAAIAGDGIDGAGELAH